MKIIECPRDAWQGYNPFIPTDQKIAYLNRLLRVGFDTIDFGSFVSSKAIPQVSDTATVVENLDISTTATKLLAIVANERGAGEACRFEKISCLGYPFSISNTFQLRNTNASMEESAHRVENIQALCEKHGKELVVYISMAFGNPYGDLWAPEIVADWVTRLSVFGITTFSLADTVGVAKADDIRSIFSTLIPAFPEHEFGAHFHTNPENWDLKITAAYDAGCRRFDGAIAGYGGCPMAQDDLVGNMPTERLIEFCQDRHELLPLDQREFIASRKQFLALISA